MQDCVSLVYVRTLDFIISSLSFTSWHFLWPSVFSQGTCSLVGPSHCGLTQPDYYYLSKRFVEQKLGSAARSVAQYQRGSRPFHVRIRIRTELMLLTQMLPVKGLHQHGYYNVAMNWKCLQSGVKNISNALILWALMSAFIAVYNTGKKAWKMTNELPGRHKQPNMAAL